jgi:hypothetical protein
MPEGLRVPLHSTANNSPALGDLFDAFDFNHAVDVPYTE